MYNQKELEPWLRRIESMQEWATDVYAVTNNPYRGQAVVNTLEIEFGLGRRILSSRAISWMNFPAYTGC